MELQDLPENREQSLVIGIEYLQSKAHQLLILREHPFSLSIVSTDGLVEIHRTTFNAIPDFQPDASLLQ